MFIPAYWRNNRRRYQIRIIECPHCQKSLIEIGQPVCPYCGLRMDRYYIIVATPQKKKNATVTVF